VSMVAFTRQGATTRNPAPEGEPAASAQRRLSAGSLGDWLGFRG
jgi:hypothetical protein